MNGARNIMRCAAYPCYRWKTYMSSENSITKFTSREVHTNICLLAKHFMEKENHYAFQTIKDKGYVVPLNMTSEYSVSQEEFQEMLKANWCKCSSKDLFETLPKFGSYCSEHNFCLSNKIFDDYVDHLTDNIKHASDYELEYLFYSLKKFPPTESPKTRNFIEIWAALDDECLNRIQNWSIDEKLKFVSLFYMLNLSRMSEFSVKCMQKLASKGKQLSLSQLVQTLFFVGVQRKSPDDMHNLEIQLGNIFDQFAINDLAILSMGFFKSKTPIRDIGIVRKIIHKVIEEASHIHEVSLAALLKVIRYSGKNENYDSIYKLLDSLQHEVSRLSVMCNVHIALLGASTLTLHKECITAVANNILSNITDTRMKDLERMVMTLGIFSYMPETEESFIEKIISELRNPTRQQEIEMHSRSFACCVSYLALLGYYPEDLMAKILNEIFLQKTYGKQVFTYGREVLAIHNSAAIFLKNSSVPSLSDKKAIILAKKYTDYFPEEAYPKEFNVSEKMILDIMRYLKDDRGGDQFVVGTHLLTHHQRGDIILCNSGDGKPLPVNETFNKSKFGLIYRAPKDNNFWIVLVFGARNSIIRNFKTPTGPFVTKLRELKELGFYPGLILWHDYIKLQTKEEKIKFINSVIDKALCDR